jgi:hypothetical protein
MRKTISFIIISFCFLIISCKEERLNYKVYFFPWIKLKGILGPCPIMCCVNSEGHKMIAINNNYSTIDYICWYDKINKKEKIIFTQEDWLYAGEIKNYKIHNLRKIAEIKNINISDISLDGNELLLFKDDDIWKLNINNLKMINLTNTPKYDEWWAKFSPTNEEEIIYVFRRNVKMNWDIVKMNTKTGQKIKLTHHLAHDWSPIWTSDGEKIIFVRDSNPPEAIINPQIWIMDKDGKNKRKIAEFKRKKLIRINYLSLSPDNKEIIFEALEPKNMSGIYKINIDGTGLKRLLKKRIGPIPTSVGPMLILGGMGPISIVPVVQD